MCDETPEVTGVISLSSKMEVRQACDDIVRAVKQFNYGEKDQFAVRLAVGEALTNAIIHGNKEDPEKKARIDYAVYRDKIHIEVTDEGDGFDYTRVDDCTKPDNIMRTGGRGVCLIREFMDEVKYAEQGNSLLMARHRRNEECREDSA